jgi:hypothetical protein
MAGDDRRPPRSGQFKPGQSGNPNGRPKGALGLKTLLGRELAQTVSITEAGRTYKASKLHVVIKRLVERASRGEPRAISQLLDLVVQLFGVEGDAPKAAALGADDQAIMDAWLKRMREDDGRLDEGETGS